MYVGWSWHRTASSVPLLCKQIPAAFFGLFWLAKTQSSVLGENRLMHLILLIQFAMPSASVSACSSGVVVLVLIRSANTNHAW